MKYCTQCGQELVDEAKICSKCGSEQKEPDKKGKRSLPISNSFLPLNIANFLFWILIIVAATFMMIAIFNPYVYVSHYAYDTYDYYVYIDPDFAWSLTAFIISAVSLAFSSVPIITGIVGLVMKKIKSNFVFGAVTQFFLSGGLFTVTLLMLIH